MEKKTFTIAGLRKELDDMKRGKSFVSDGSSSFGNFDNLDPSPLNQSKAILRKAKKVSLGRGVESFERQRPRLSSMRSVRSLGTVNSVNSDQGLLTGRRMQHRNSPLGLGRTPTIEEDEGDDEEAGILGKTSSATTLDKSRSENRNPGMAGAHAMLPNLKLFGALKKTFKGKKPTPIGNADGGGLLHMAHNDDFDTSESKAGFSTDGSSYNHLATSFAQHGPLPLPVQNDEIRELRPIKMFEKMNMKGALSKVKKLRGRRSGNRRGSIMITDDG